MDPAFSIQKLAKHLPKFYDVATGVCDTLEAAQMKNSGKPIDVLHMIQPFAIGECLQ